LRALKPAARTLEQGCLSAGWPPGGWHEGRGRGSV